MHPALSVIFFTTLSGLGYGLLAWSGVAALIGTSPRALLAALVLGVLTSTVGLLCSVGHLGKPLRAWRAFSQWRSSWLSREGVVSLATFVPALLLIAAFAPRLFAIDLGSASLASGIVLAAAAGLVVVGALATVYCTSMIYASLKPIPAWTHRSVPAVYVLFSGVSGGLAFLALRAIFGATPSRMTLLLTIIGLGALALLKARYWSAIDTTPLPVTRGDAIGLPAREVSVFERPHTEGNFVTREMVFVLARKHAAVLRAIAMIAFATLPALALAISWMLPAASSALLIIATLSVLAGAFVERWLFFAEARHVVSQYY
ncbi:dimethyl sulfoxide reductase anchor subunit [Lysobacter sp. TY2-98]|uniref:dimethyl sulfoxide reductase anchor subunit family protein n=1 Tax=Lysobacter sp. TY2-98 TaxID=2290922 RepID=UPI000E1FFD57|nr:DmsC/YnfH family molybdoenzyme membrane anchor subunit [Lysobacter sp. TY2-98]AXK73433.1 dimethyl sulfoxide reductase anchor subunit [Lysobacter sp. TY2-98]